MSLPGRSDNLYSAFFQDEINLVADRLWLTLGTKYEHNDYTGSEWQPNAKLLWKPKENHSLWASAARAVRTPSIVEQYGRVLMGRYQLFPTAITDLNFVGNEDFDSEIVNAYELCATVGRPPKNSLLIWPCFIMITMRFTRSAPTTAVSPLRSTIILSMRNRAMARALSLRSTGRPLLGFLLPWPTPIWRPI